MVELIMTEGHQLRDLSRPVSAEFKDESSPATNLLHWGSYEGI